MTFNYNLKIIKKVNIIGHSLREVDIPYFCAVKNNVMKDAIWNIYYYLDGDKLMYRDKIDSLWIDYQNIRIIKSNKFYNKEI